MKHRRQQKKLNPSKRERKHQFTKAQMRGKARCAIGGLIASKKYNPTWG